MIGRNLKVLKPALVLVLLGLAGCQSLPPIVSAERETMVCPPAPVTECPVCESRACPAPSVIERVVTAPAPQPEPPSVKLPATAGKLDLPVVGGIEHARVEPPDMRVVARMDTGIELSLLRVEMLQEVEKDGEAHAVFSIRDSEGKSLEVERPLLRYAQVRIPGGEQRRLPVVRLWLSIGESRDLVELGLSDKGRFEHSLVVGRNFLTDMLIVDVSQRYMLD